MYEYIKGTLASVESNYVVVESNLVGYKIFVTPNALSNLGSLGSEVKVYTYLNVKEDTFFNIFSVIGYFPSNLFLSC